MNDCFLRRVLPGIVVLAALCMSGCNDEALTTQYYALDIERRAVPLQKESRIHLEVRRLSVDSVYAARELTYRQGSLAYQIDHYHQLVIAPGQMITEKTRTWLMQSGLFARVLDPGSLSVPTHCLEGNVTALYGDFRDKNAPAAVVAMRLFLIDPKPANESILHSKAYEARVPLETFDAPGLVAGYNTGIEQILIQLENDLSEIL